MQVFAALLISYLLGSISFSFLAGKLLKGIDIRKHGSGNAGATNTLRILGKGPAIAVLALDVLKGIAAVWIGRWLGGDSEWIPVWAGLSVIAGHNWPVFFGFKGGKGIATAIGVTATLCFLPALFAGIIAIGSIVITRYVSLGSLIFTGLLPISILLMGEPAAVLVGSLLIALFSFVRHRTNIVKLIRKQENKLGNKK
ncbi:glycerol-3-phosphate 1-O-acyltransferase PlsY [Paenibacillus sp. J2TS4]|uniref:glycerol-3-phosphate 1-O-acyltransferase PlsY n=1 Tax=Paenibacillus sp. J2TS4 TaxID=2807194 RepID=UPI001B1137B7|nr:glycerol-3-phosphate 1-O-acyltransferase PlsY [Paenibacillus sp. J2TS4]GIP32375.1 glycerol-3-phosphate acyltransferase 2 [Paenibacillus sp. J2TS4]